MARYAEAVCKLCRREGQKLFLKGERCYGEKCGVVKKAYAPGQHGKGRKKNSEYGLQLRAKQSTRRFYGILENQFRKYYELAEKKKGKSGEILLALIESRFDNIIYRLGFASSRTQARQMVLHGHFFINNSKVNIPSCLLKPSDIVSLSEKSKSNSNIKDIISSNESRPVPRWLEVDRERLEGKMLAIPEREDIDFEVEETLIVELYSK
ncbi:MAG: 30S ribosomal protein S4 [Oscillospiraceae bacterium]|jgi:small subunit ribosomal protein S4|nr:30S ribosomal protein S4 [Oscillospiraceae bacterium]